MNDEHLIETKKMMMEIEERLGGKTEAYAIELLRTAQYWIRQGLMLESSELFLAEAQTVFRVDGIAYGACLNALANLYQALGRYKELENLQHRSLEIVEKHTGKESLEYGRVLHGMANTQHILGRYQDAELLYLQSLGIEKSHGHGKTLEYGIGLHGLACLYETLGRYDESEELFLRALEIEKEHNGEESQGCGRNYHGLANLYQEIGRYEEAEKLHLQSMEIESIYGGEDSLEFAASLNDLANLYEKLGRYDEAEKLYFKSLEIKGELFGEDSAAYSIGLHGLANLYTNFGPYEDAEVLLKKALAIQERHYDEEGISYSATFHALANLYEITGRYTEAKWLYFHSLDIISMHSGKESLEYSASLHGLGTLYESLGKYQEAATIFLQSLEIEGAVSGKESLGYGQSLHGLAIIYARLGQTDQAEHAFETVVGIFKSNGGTRSFDYVTVLNNYANLLIHIGEPSIAFSKNIEAMRAQLSSLQALYESISLTFFKSARRRTETSNHLFLSLLLKQVSSEETHRYLPMLLELQVGELYVTGLRRKLFEANASEEERSRYEELASGLQRLGTQASPEIAARRNQLGEALQTLQSSVLVRRKGLVPQRGRKEAKASLTPLFDAWAPGGFEPGARGVGYLRYYDYIKKEDRYGALLLTTHPFEDSRIQSLGPAAPVDEAAQALLEAIAAQDSAGQHEALTELARLLKAPIGSWLQGTEHLSISAEGALTLLPLELLFEGIPLRTLNSLSDLFWLGQLEKPEAADSIILANPDFDLPYFPDDGEGSPNTEKPNGLKGGTDRTPHGGFRGIEFPIRPLPGTGEEARQVGRLLGLSEDRILTGDRFVKPAIHDIRNPRILHIATHGLYLPAEDRGKSREDDFFTFEDRARAHDDPYERCFLLASGASQIEFESGAYRHYMITGKEIMNMELSGTRLAVLSACQTGIGEISQSEGVIGMRRAFMLAQVPTIICSLWEVDDRAAAILMHRFYTNLKQGHRADASLEEAKRYMRGATALQLAEEGWPSLREEHGDHKRPFEAPKYWAAFICVGMGDAVM